MSFGPSELCRLSRPDRRQLAFDLAAALHQLVIGLKPHPEAFREPEETREPQIRVRGDRALAENDLVDPPRRHLDRASERVLTEPHGLQKLREKDASRRRVRDEISGSR